MKRAEIFAALDRGFGGKGLEAGGVGIEVREGIELAFAFGDAFQRGVDYFHGRSFLRADGGAQAGDGGVEDGTHAKLIRA